MSLRPLAIAVISSAMGLAAGLWLLPQLPGLQGEPVADAQPHAGDGGAVPQWYTCGMHPEVVQDHPGDCPKCGMKLHAMPPDRVIAMALATDDGVRAPAAPDRAIAYWRSPMVPGELYAGPGVDAMGHDRVPVHEDEIATGIIRIDPVTEQNMGIRVAEVTSGSVRGTIRTVGIVEYDESALAAITAKVDGWVEKLHVDRTGAQVHRGDALFDIYSPTLFAAQEEYLAALRAHKRNQDAGNRGAVDSAAMVRDARIRLEYFDVPPAQIRELENTGQARKALTIRSPFTGIVIEKGLVAGQRVDSGADLFRIADLSTVWVIGKVFENDLPFLTTGQEAFMTLGYAPGRTFRGRVTYIYPYLEANTREIPVRMEFHNPGYDLKPGMYATISLTHEVAEEATLVPDMAVIRTGVRDVAFVVREPGRFELRHVEIGARAEGDRLQVLSGLIPGELVVVSGQFLLDSESRLREAALKFTQPGLVDRRPPAAAAPSSPPATGDRLYHVCPMPEHVDVLYDLPGDCPLCGMKLVPLPREATAVDATGVRGGSHDDSH